MCKHLKNLLVAVAQKLQSFVAMASVSLACQVWLGNIPSYMDEEQLLAELQASRIIPWKIRYRPRGKSKESWPIILLQIMHRCTCCDVF